MVNEANVVATNVQNETRAKLGAEGKVVETEIPLKGTHNTSYYENSKHMPLADTLKRVSVHFSISAEENDDTFINEGADSGFRLTPATICSVPDIIMKDASNRQVESREECDREHQSKTVYALLKQEYSAKAKKYVLEKAWWDRWQAWSQGIGQVKRPGKVSNLDLIKEEYKDMQSPLNVQQHLKEDVVEGEDYILIASDVWEALVSMNGGDGGPVVLSDAINFSKISPIIKEKAYLKPQNEDEESQSKEPEPWNLCWDQKYGLQCEILAEEEDAHASLQTESDDMEIDSDILKDFRTKKKRLTVCLCCLSKRATNTCRACGIARYCSRTCQEAHWPFHRTCCKKKLVEYDYQFFGRRGMVGLTNLGNTCFLNSTIQCLSHTWPLTRFLLNNSYLKDLNTVSKLGTGGELVKVYRDVITQLWFSSEPSHSPSKLKREIGNLPGSGNQFSGYMQQDAQELLVFLLDTLHEDLNLVKQKPYIKLPDEDIIDKRPIAEQAEESWHNTELRDNSIITKLFQGQTQSTITCPDCNYKSVTFSPFMFLPLAIPTTTDRTIIVTVVFKSDQSMRDNQFVKRVRYAITLSNNAKVQNLRAAVATACGIPEEKLWFVDIFNHRIWKHIQDSMHIRQIEKKDVIYAFEISAAPSSPRIAVVLQATNSMDDNVVLQGTPLIMAYDNDTTFLELRKKALDSILSVSNSQSKGSEFENIISKLPIYRCDEYGRKMYVNPLDRMDDSPEQEERGTYLPNTTQEVSQEYKLENVIYLAIDWTTMEKELNISYDESNFPLTNDDKSAEDIERVEKQIIDVGGAKCSLQDCLRHFLKAEQLDQGNTWKCPRCKMNKMAVKAGALRRLPKILILFLKRFEHSSYSRSKLSTLVDFPLTSLDMTEHLAEDVQGGAETVYDLYAVTNHYGSMGFGHYTAFVAGKVGSSSEPLEWHEIDDCRIIAEKPDKICSSAAYVLYYRLRKS